MNEKEMGASEIYLAPQTEVFDQAAEIAQTTVADTKYPFVLEYDLNDKEYLLSVLNAAGAVVIEEHDSANSMTVSMNMSQLRLIKSLDCITRVKTDEGKSMRSAAFAARQTNNESVAAATAEAQVMTLANYEVMAANEVNAASADDGIAVACVSGCTTGNNTKETALEIPVEKVVNGCICCPGAEQWFKFTVPENKQYTIYTKGLLDTVGTLYDYNDEELEHNDDCAGMLNFRIKHVLNTGETYYVKVKCYGNNTGNYKLNVTKCVLVDSVDINKPYMILGKNVLYELPVTPNHTNTWYKGAHKIPGFSVTLDPDNADKKTVWWSSDSSGILDVSQGWDDEGKRYAHLIGTERGIAKLYAEDWDRSGTPDECIVYVGGCPVSGIKFEQSRKYISIGDTETLKVVVLPTNALNKEVVWSSSDPRRVQVDEYGCVTAVRNGKADITATTVEGMFKATCEVIVDSREKVTITKDGEYFNVEFEDGLIWKSIGCDLTLEENQSEANIWQDEEYNQLTVPEQRYKANILVDYSAEQLAFLYLCDPLGVEHYLKEYSPTRHETTTAHMLWLKDDTFKEIFGCWPRLIKILPDKTVLYESYSRQMDDADRENYLSDAEVLFGEHFITDWFSFFSIALDVLNGIVASFLTLKCPPLGAFMITLNLTKYLFFNGAIEDVMADGSSEVLNEYTRNIIAASTTNQELINKLAQRFSWLTAFLNLIPTVLEAVSELVPSLEDIRVYNRINSESFRASFVIDDIEMSMQEFLDYCNS